MITFSEAYTSLGPDVEAIAELLDIDADEADRLVNAEMDKRYAQQSIKEFWREENARKLSEIMEARL